MLDDAMDMHAVSPAVLLVEDDPLVLRALTRLLAPVAGVETAATFAEAVRLLPRARWTTLIVDPGLPDGDGFEVVRLAGSGGAPPPTIVLTGRHDRAAVNRASALGAVCVVKPAPDSFVTTYVQRALRSQWPRRGADRVESTVAEWTERYRLTESERRVLVLLIQGYTREQIAEARGHGLATTRKHIENLLAKTSDAAASAAVIRLLKEALARDASSI